jgi:hypothetical protein
MYSEVQGLGPPDAFLYDCGLDHLFDFGKRGDLVLLLDDLNFVPKKLKYATEFSFIV